MPRADDSSRSTRPDSSAAAPELPAPRFAAGWASLTYAICTLLLAWPALGGGFLVSPHSDQYIAGFPFREFAAQSLRSGTGFPQWNPYLFGGMPYIAAMHGDIFYPTFLLRMVMPTDMAMTWGFALHLFLAGVFTYAFLRAWGFGFWPSLIGGVAYMLSGQVASLVSPGHDGKLFVSALLPAALWCLVRGVRDGRAAAWGALAITVGLAVLSPHPQLLQYLLLTSGAFALFIARSRGEGATVGAPMENRVALRRLGLALAAVIVGMLIGAVQFLPVREYVSWSPRAGGRGGYQFATSFSMPVEELFNTYLPQFTGMLDAYWGRNSIHLHSEYLGVVVLLLATAALGATLRRGFRTFWVGTCIVAVLWALGEHTPFYHLVYALVPGSKFFRAPSTIFYVASFSAAMLATIGVERVLQRRVGSRFAFGWVGFGALVALLATGGMLTNLAQAVASTYAGGQLYEMVQSNNGALVIGAWRSFLFVALTAAALVGYQRGKGSARGLAITLAVLMVVDLWSVDRAYWLFSPRADQVYASDAVIDAIHKDPEPARVIAFADSRSPMADRDPYLTGDALMHLRVRQVTGYHGNELGRYQRLGGKSDSTRYDMSHLLNPAFWRLTNTRYLYTNAVIPDSQLKRVAGPVKNGAGTMVSIYRLPGDNPFAWVTAGAVKGTDDQAYSTILDQRFSPARIAIFDSATKSPTQQVTVLPDSLVLPVHASHYSAGHIALELAAPAPAGSVLMVSENYYPGWSATVDGKPATVERADLSLMGIPLTAGARSVKLDFNDAAYSTGKPVTMLALLVAVVAFIGGLTMDRRAARTRLTPASA
ncbi:MAG: Protein of unknown function, rane YfhO [Gemmatimonadetes bacterium]|nr:Protein of unknown function, rane YfhO [Gemmatimonadota bacterium]